MHSWGPDWGHSRGFPVCAGWVFLRPPQGSALVHRMYTGRPVFRLARRATAGAKSKQRISLTMEGSKVIKAAVEICPLCEGTGWKTVGGGTNKSANDRRVARCDCRLRARGQSLLTAARIPRRYEHCELSNYDTDFPGQIRRWRKVTLLRRGLRRSAIRAAIRGC